MEFQFVLKPECCRDTNTNKLQGVRQASVLYFALEMDRQRSDKGGRPEWLRGPFVGS